MTRNTTPAKDQHYAYDENGNRSRDERGTYTYDPRDHLTSWNRDPDVPFGGAGNADLLTYEINGDGAIRRSEDAAKGITVSNEYRGDRLVASESTKDGVTTTSTYHYNGFGDVDRINATAPGHTPATINYLYDETARSNLAPEQIR